MIQSTHRAPPRSKAARAPKFHFIIGLATLLVQGASNHAFADEKAPPNPDERAHAQATAQLNEAYTAKNQADWPKAQKHFNEAFQLWPNDKTAAELGEAELRTGNCSQAAEHLNWAAQHGTPDAVELRRRLDRVADAKQRTEVLKLRTSVRDARLFVDGEEAGMGPILNPLCVRPGRHRVEARRTSGESAYKDIEIEQGKGADIRLDRFGKQAPEEEEFEVVREAIPWWKAYLVPVGLGLFVTAVGFGTGFAVKYHATNEEARLHHQWMEELYGEKLYTKEQQVCAQAGALNDCMQQARMIEIAQHNRWATIASFSLAGAFIISTAVIAAIPSGKKPKARTDHLRIEPVIAGQSIGIQGSF